MQAFRVTDFTKSPSIARIEKPVPGEGEVLLQVQACGLNFADLLMARGEYQDTPALPFTLGLEMAGTVVATGRGQSRIPIGGRFACFSGSGGLAEFACVPANSLVSIPQDMPANDAAAFMVAYGTSHVALSHKARLLPGETLLVLGAAGGVGLTAVEIGKLMGAQVIACARGNKKLEAAEAAGADHLIDTTTDDLKEKVRALGGADVVYDPVGGALFNAALRCTRPEGRILIIGFASGDIPQVPANIMLVKNISALGFYWGGYLKFRPDVVRDSLTELVNWYADGRIRPHIGATFPLERAADALALLRERKSTGKVVVEIAPS